MTFRQVILTGLLGIPVAFGAADTPNPGLRYYYPAPGAPVVDVAADVIVYGGTSGGVVAAVQARRMGKSVALVVFGRHVGGMTSGGLTETDGVNAAVQGGITREFFTITGNSGFKPSKAEAAFEAMLADPVPGESWDSPVPVYYEQRLERVEKNGARIIALHMENGSVFRGRMFIDCSYEGDLMAGAGVSYFVGREDGALYGESRAGKKSPASLPGVNAYAVEGDPDSGLLYNLIDEPAGRLRTGDDHVQAYNFRMYTVQKADPAARQPLFKPAAYDESKFEILYRYHRAGGATSMTVGNDINNHDMFNRGVSTDHIGGNRWPDGRGGWVPWADADYTTRELIYQDHVAWQLGMLWYLRTNARYRALATDPELSPTIRNNIQALLNKIDNLGFPPGEYPETGGWPHELYVREARRMVSDLVMTQAHFDRGLVVEDAVGLANYGSDSHHVRRIQGPGGTVRVEGDTGGGSTPPWRISYRALTPKAEEAENLLVTWAVSLSHVAFGSMRMEPCHMVLSQSAATAAALCLDRDLTVQELPYPLLKRHLLADGQILGDPPLPESGSIVDNARASGVEASAGWIASSATSGYHGTDYLHDNNSGSTGGLSVGFTPDLSEAGEYEVFARWTAHTNRATRVPIDIHHTGGKDTVSVNQQAKGGAWVSLGSYPFAAGEVGKVVIRNDGADGYVIADAVRWVPASELTPSGAGIQVLAASAVALEEGTVPGRFQVMRDTLSLTTPVTVKLQAGGTAVPGTHYAPLPTSVTLPAGVVAVSVWVRPVSGNLAQGGRSVTLSGDFQGLTRWLRGRALRRGRSSLRGKDAMESKNKIN